MKMLRYKSRKIVKKTKTEKVKTSRQERAEAEKQFKLAYKIALNKFGNAITGGLLDDGRIVFHTSVGVYAWVRSFYRNGVWVKGHFKRIR